MTINGGSEFMTYGGDDYYGGGFKMEDLHKLLTAQNVVIAIVLVLIIVYIYNNNINTKSKGSSASAASSNNFGGNIYVPSRINKLENSEYVYGGGTNTYSTDPVSNYYTFVPA